MKYRTSSNDTCTRHRQAHIPGGWSAAAKVLVIMIASLLLLSLRALITRAEDPPIDPAGGSIYLPVVAHPSDPLPPGPGWTDAEKRQIKNFVDKAAKLAPLADNRHDTETDTLEPGDDYQYTYEKHDVVDNIDNVIYLGLNDDIVWPGNLVKGSKAHDFVYDPIVLPRAPIMLSVSLESACTGPSITHEVIDPKLSTVRQGISDLLKKAIVDCTKVPAQADFKVEQVYNESHMNLFAAADISYAAGSLDAKFNWDSTTKKNKIMARYRQIYYSIDIDTPANPAALFDPSRTSVAKIGEAMPAGSMPMYVASVKYGMMAYLLIETDFSEEEMALALDTAYGKGDLEAKFDFGYSTREVMDRSNVNIVVYGGSTAGLDELETGFQGLKNVMWASRDFTPDSPGVPLVYKFRHLKDNTLGLITLTSQYTIVKPLQIQQRVRITVDRWVIISCDDEGSDNTVDIDRLAVWVNGWNRSSTNDPGVPVNIPDHPKGTTVSYLETSDEWPMCDGAPYEKYINQAEDLTFSTDNYDFNLAKLELQAWARDWDTSDSDSENAYGSMTLLGNQFFGEKEIYLNCPDFTGFFLLIIEPLYTPPSPPPSPFSGTSMSFN